MNNSISYEEFLMKQFVKKAGKLIENGYAYANAHPEASKILQSEMRRVQEIEEMSRIRPNRCYKKMLKDAYTQLITIAVKFGLKFVKNNRSFYDDFAELRNVVNEVSRLQNSHNFSHSRRCEAPNRTYVNEPEDSTEEIFSTTFQQLENLVDKIDNLRSRMDKINAPKFNRKKTSSDGIRDLNWELEEKLRKLKLERSRRFREMQNSELNSSEEILNFEDFSQQLMSSPKIKKANPNFNRNVAAEARPKIASKFIFRRNEGGKMSFDISLDFVDGILMDEKLAKGVYIESVLPVKYM